MHTCFHKYAYVHSDPIDNWDPTGEFSSTQISVGIGIGAVLSGIAGFSLFGPDVREPTFLEGLIPIYGPSWSAVYNFQNGNYVLGAFNSLIAVSDIFFAKAIIQFAFKSLVTDVGANAAGKGASVVFTKVPLDDIGKIAGDKLYKSGVEGAVYGMAVDNASALASGVSSAGKGTVRWTGQAADLFGAHSVDGFFSGYKHFTGQLKAGFGNIELIKFTRVGDEIVVESAKLAAKSGVGQFVGEVRLLGRIFGEGMVINRFSHTLVNALEFLTGVDLPGH